VWRSFPTTRSRVSRHRYDSHRMCQPVAGGHKRHSPARLEISAHGTISLLAGGSDSLLPERKVMPSSEPPTRSQRLRQNSSSFLDPAAPLPASTAIKVVFFCFERDNHSAHIRGATRAWPRHTTDRPVEYVTAKHALDNYRGLLAPNLPARSGQAPSGIQARLKEDYGRYRCRQSQSRPPPPILVLKLREALI